MTAVGRYRQPVPAFAQETYCVGPEACEVLARPADRRTPHDLQRLRDDGGSRIAQSSRHRWTMEYQEDRPRPKNHHNQADERHRLEKRVALARKPEKDEGYRRKR